MDNWPGHLIRPPSPSLVTPHPQELSHLVLPPLRIHETAHLRNHLETLRDVESAFQNADLALRNAREALRGDRIMSGRNSLPRTNSHTSDNPRRVPSGDNGDVVDLTSLSSDTSNEEVDHQRTQHQSSRQASRSGPVLARHHVVPTHPVTGEPMPRYTFSWSSGILRPLNNHRAEENAVRRQRQARRSWERVERRNRERAAEQAQRDAVERARTLADQTTSNEEAYEDTNDNRNITRARRSSSTSSAASLSDDSEYSIDSAETRPTTNPNTQNSLNSTITTSTMIANDPIDLTDLDGQSVIENVLSLQQQAAIEAQKLSTASKNSDPTAHATPLATYKCAICMETPTTATSTICGHLFCYTCLKDSLKWSAQQRRDDAGLHGRRAPAAGQGLCPVCRKALNDKDTGSKQGIVGLEIKTISRKDWERKKKQQNEDEERERFLRDLDAFNHETQQKGKEREGEQSSGSSSQRSGRLKMESQAEDLSLDASRLMGRQTRKRPRDDYGVFENSEGF